MRVGAVKVIPSGEEPLVAASGLTLKTKCYEKS